MNALEFVDNNKLAILLCLAVVAAAILYLLLRRTSGSSYSTSDANQSMAVMKEFTDLKTELSGQATLKKLIAGSRDSEPSPSGWLKHEEQVCERFARLRERLKPSGLFRSSKEYLATAHEANRTIKPNWVYVMFVILVVTESYAFNLLLADYIAWGSTPFQQMLVAWGLCFAFSILCVGMAEFAGKCQYVQSLAYYAFRTHQGASSDGEDLRRKEAIQLDKNDADKADPTAIRLLNRSEKVSNLVTVGSEVKRISPWLIFVSCILLLAMVLIFGLRVFDLNQKEIQQIRLQQDLISEQTSTGKSNEAPIPKELKDTQAKADEQAIREQDSDKHTAFKWAFAIFSVLFLGVQFIGVLLAYSYGFASDHGEAAYLATKDFNAAGAYEEFQANLRRDLDGFAQQTLSTLQQLVTVESDKVNLKNSWRNAIKSSSNRTFGSYLQQRVSLPDWHTSPAVGDGSASNFAQRSNAENSIRSSPSDGDFNSSRVFYTATAGDGTLSQGLIELEELKTKVLRDRLDPEKVTITLQGGQSMSLHQFLSQSTS